MLILSLILTNLQKFSIFLLSLQITLPSLKHPAHMHVEVSESSAKGAGVGGGREEGRGGDAVCGRGRGRDRGWGGDCGSFNSAAALQRHQFLKAFPKSNAERANWRTGDCGNSYCMLHTYNSLLPPCWPPLAMGSGHRICIRIRIHTEPSRYRASEICILAEAQLQLRLCLQFRFESLPSPTSLHFFLVEPSSDWLA